MITQAGQVVVQLADNVMVGHLGAAELAGVSFANAIYMIGFVFAIGFAQGITPIVGQSFGKGEYFDVAKTFKNAFVLNLFMSLILTAILAIIGFFMGYMGQDSDVVRYAKEYYFINVASTIPTIIFLSIRFFSEGIGNTKYAMYITIFANILNIFLNWILIFGKWGAPHLGVAGAAYATFIARVLSAILFVIILYKAKEYNTYITILKLKLIDKKSIIVQLKTSIPISFQNLLEVTAFSFTAIMVGWMGKYELAAHQIAHSLSHLSFMIATGIGAAATIRVSHQFGSGHFKDMYMAGKASVHMSIALMGACGIIYVLFYKSIPYLYTSDPNVIPIASNLIIVISLFQIWDAIQLASISSLRGMKDINKPLLFSAISYYVICLPSAYILGFVFDLGPVGVWLGLLLGLTFAGILFYTRFTKLCSKYITQNK